MFCTLENKKILVCLEAWTKGKEKAIYIPMVKSGIGFKMAYRYGKW